MGEGNKESKETCIKLMLAEKLVAGCRNYLPAAPENSCSEMMALK